GRPPSAKGQWIADLRARQNAALTTRCLKTALLPSRSWSAATTEFRARGHVMIATLLALELMTAAPSPAVPEPRPLLVLEQRPHEDFGLQRDAETRRELDREQRQNQKQLEDRLRSEQPSVDRAPALPDMPGMQQPGSVMPDMPPLVNE